MSDFSIPSRSDDNAPGLDFDLAAVLPDVTSDPSSTSAPTSNSSPHPLTLQLFQPLRLTKLAFVVGLAALLPYLLQRLPDLRSRPEYVLKTSDIQLVPAPDRPVPTSLVDQVRLQRHLPAELSLLDPKLCETLSDAFSSHPWIARVISVHKTHPPAVVVRVEYRRPVAMVQVRGGRVPIDAQGTALPSEDFGVADVAEYPTIRLAGSASLNQIGGRFKEPGLPGAVQIAELLNLKWNSLGLEAIEMPRASEQSGDPADIQFQIATRVGSTIIWGRSPGTDHPGELTPAQKVARLEKYLAEFGAFDRPNGPYEIDIRHWQEITRRPSNKTQAASRREGRPR